MPCLQRHLSAGARTPHEQTALERQIAAKEADRRAGLRAVRADGGGDRDCGGEEMIRRPGGAYHAKHQS